MTVEFTALHRMARKADSSTWKCEWCGLELQAHGDVTDAAVVEMGNGSPCTLGVQVSDAVKTEDKLK